MQITPAEIALKERIKKSGMRMNKTKKLVFELLKESDHPLSPQEIASQIPSVHFVSIYRTLDSLRQAGVVSMVPRGFKNLFELSDHFSPHHHHISCEYCGSMKGIDSQEIETLIEKISKQSGFSSTKHHLELYGICSSCSQLKN